MKFLRYEDLQRYGITWSCVHLDRRRRADKFPREITIGANTAAYLESEIVAWIGARLQDRGARNDQHRHRRYHRDRHRHRHRRSHEWRVTPPRRKPTGRIAPMVLATEAKASDTVIALVQPQPFTEVSSLAQRANEAHARASAAALNVVEHAIAAGAALIEARKLVAHRDWLRWVGNGISRPRDRPPEILETGPM